MSVVDRFLAPFRRVTSGGGLVPEIDGLRFIAIGVVVIFHLNGYVVAKSARPFASSPMDSPFFHFAALGHYGVQLFFVISGFILALPFARHYLEGSRPISLQTYFVRRLTRLEPPYILNLLICTALMAALKMAAPATLVPHLGASVLYLHNGIYGQGSLINSVAWSLEIEVQFYVLVPLLTRLFAIQPLVLRRSLIVALALTVPALLPLLTANPVLRSLTVLGFLQFFLMGFLLADLFIVSWRMAPRPGWGWDLLSPLGWIGFFAAGQLAKQHILVAELLMPFAALAAYIAAFKGVLSSSLFRNRWLVTIGGMCYTIYLYHYLMISAVGRLSLRLRIGDSYLLNYGLQLAIVGAVVVLISALLFRLAERPFMDKNWPARIWGLVHRRAFSG